MGIRNCVISFDPMTLAPGMRDKRETNGERSADISSQDGAENMAAARSISVPKRKQLLPDPKGKLSARDASFKSYPRWKAVSFRTWGRSTVAQHCGRAARFAHSMHAAAFAAIRRQRETASVRVV